MPSLGPTELIIIGVILLIITAVVVTLLRGQSPTGGQRLLRRWGIPEPTPEQGAAAAGYLRSRRRRYVPIFIGLWIAAGFVLPAIDVPGGTNWFLLILGTLVASLLIGELSAILRPALLSRRSAPLVRRGITDLVPLYGVIAYVGMTVVAAFGVTCNLVLAVVGRPVDAKGIGTMWALLAALLLVIASTCMVVWLSLVRGPLYEDGAVDAALRIRTARVTTAVGLLLTWWVIGVAFGRLSELSHVDPLGVQPPLLEFVRAVQEPATTVSFIVGLLVWAMLVNPIRKQRLVEAYR